MAPAAVTKSAVQVRRQAALYVRMSTDHQRYSTASQSAALQTYAEAHGLTVTRTYADEGKSGLRLAGRRGLEQLIQDVQGGEAEFGVLLVYDISRWGRFQDADESAYYEYLCRRAGVAVIYCAEPFENDGTPIATIVKSVKRAMAGEFSRELSVKVFAGHARLVRLGFKQGGPPGFGYRRQLVDSSGRPKAILRRGDRKSLQDDRVVLVPGPPREVAAVQLMFETFAGGEGTCDDIARGLNAEGVTNACGRPWTPATVGYLLRSEKYAGTSIYGRTASKLKQARVRVTPEAWIRREDAHPALISADLFSRAQKRFAEAGRRQSDDEIIAQLRSLLRRKGRLTGDLIDADRTLMGAHALAQRFGSLDAAYARVGFCRPRGSPPGRRATPHRSKRTAVVCGMLTELQRQAIPVTDQHAGVFLINNAFTVTVSQARPVQRWPEPPCWVFNLKARAHADFRILARQMGPDDAVLDYLILPTHEAPQARLSLALNPARPYSFYRFATLNPLFEMARPIGAELS